MTGTSPILVTGGLGFVARWLIGDLLDGGPPVIGAGRLPAGGHPPERLGAFMRAGPDREITGGVRYQDGKRSWVFIPCDLHQPDAVARLLAAAKPAFIYHLAAQSSAARSFGRPGETFATNVTGSLNLLEAVRALPAGDRPTLLAAGSCEEYGAHAPDRMPLSERSPLCPVSPYGASKAAQSLLCLQYQRAFELPVLVSRAFSHTGPGQDARFVFPSFVRQIVACERGQQPAVLAVGNLQVVRDFLDVRDVVRAYRLLATRGEPGQIYNICSGRALTIRQGLEILLTSARCRLELRPDPARCRPVDIPTMIGDGTKLRQRTGWQPEHDFRDTLDEMLTRAREEKG